MGHLVVSTGKLAAGVLRLAHLVPEFVDGLVWYLCSLRCAGEPGFTGVVLALESVVVSLGLRSSCTYLYPGPTGFNKAAGTIGGVWHLDCRDSSCTGMSCESDFARAGLEAGVMGAGL